MNRMIALAGVAVLVLGALLYAQVRAAAREAGLSRELSQAQGQVIELQVELSEMHARDTARLVQIKRLEDSLNEQAERIARDDHERQAAQAAAERASRSALDRLREHLAPGSGDGVAQAAGPAAASHDPALVRELLGECAAEHQRVAAAADQLAAQVTTLQDYIATVRQVERGVPRAEP